MNSILNISAYLFVPLNDLPQLQGHIKATAQALNLRGTVLLAEEGINLFLAGEPLAVRQMVDALRADPRLQALDPKESWSSEPPFKRLLVKIKREIIRMNHPTIRPECARAPVVSPQTLAAWLERGRDDAGRPVLMLDTRNGFEVDAGGFEGAIDWRLNKFSEFPERLREHLGELREHTVVSYCTGGIRCEKAALLMRELGLPHSYQLDGGILKYFELTGGPHYRGGCFVFDERSVLASDLSPAAE